MTYIISILDTDVDAIAASDDVTGLLEITRGFCNDAVQGFAELRTWDDSREADIQLHAKNLLIAIRSLFLDATSGITSRDGSAEHRHQIREFV